MCDGANQKCRLCNKSTDLLIAIKNTMKPIANKRYPKKIKICMECYNKEK